MMNTKQTFLTRVCSLIIALGLISGCTERRNAAPEVQSTYDAYGGYGDAYGDAYGTGEITFLDQVKTNATVEDDFGQLVFQDIEGNEFPLDRIATGKALVVVITRGYTNPICPYCSTQVARLIDQYSKISSLNAEVVVVYPVVEKKDGTNLEAFLTKSREVINDPQRPVPFPVLLDMQLTNVNRLGIRKDLSKPATYIIDSQGRVRFAYIGESLSDRPSAAAVLAELQKLADNR